MPSNFISKLPVRWNPLLRQLAGAAVALYSVGVAAGLLLGWPWWGDATDTRAMMVLNTALSLSVLGLTIALGGGPASTGLWRRRLSLLVLLVCGLVLLESVFSIDLGLDHSELHVGIDLSNPYPGRMAPNTALSLMVAAACLYLGTFASIDQRLLTALGAAVLTFGLLGLLSHAPVLDASYAWFGIPRMAIATGCSVSIVGVLLLTGSDRPWYLESLRGSSTHGDARVYGVFSAALVVVLAVATASFGSFRALDDRVAWVEHSYEVRAQFETFTHQVDRLRVHWRRYLVSGQEQDLERYSEALTSAYQSLDSLLEIVSDNPYQLHRLESMREALGAVVARIQPYMLSRQGGHLIDSAAIIEALSTPLGLEPVEELATQFRDAEAQLLDERRHSARASFQGSQLILFSGNVLGLGVLVLAFAKLMQTARERDRLESVLIRSNEQLEDSVQSRTEDLSQAVQELEALNNSLEQRVIERTAELDDLYDNAPCGYQSIDADGVLRRINATQLRWLGYAREELVDKVTMAELLAPPDRAQFSRYLKALHLQGECPAQEFAILRKDGSLFGVSISAAPVHDAQGRFLGARMTAFDITERRASDQRAHATRVFLDSLIDTLPVAVLIKRVMNRRFVRINRAAEWLLGRTRQEVLEHESDLVFDGPSASELDGLERLALAGTLPDHPVRLNLTTPAGERRIVRPTMRSIPGADGHEILLLIILQDVTSDAQAQDEIQALNRSLERHAQKLETAVQDLEGFSYSVSHDLRAPLRAINGYAQMLAEDCSGQLDEEGLRYVGLVRRHAQHMGELIDDLLRFSRMGRAAINAGPIDMNRMAEDVRQELARLDPSGNLPHRFDIQALPTAYGDPALIRQVWVNLIANAIKYSSKQAEPCIVIQGHCDASECTYSVRDNGAGFSMAHAHRLFGVFQRLHSSDEFPGTGVGLAIVHRIVTRHGGRVWPQAEPGAGATFSFTLPQPSETASSGP